MKPQLAPTAEQLRLMQVVPVQTPATQANPVGQVPQETESPQPSLTKPQLALPQFPDGVQVPVLQTLGVPPPPHMAGLVQVPQSTSPPQPSEMNPHCAPTSLQILGEHTGVPHTFAVPPPPHVAGATHVPQLRISPQPSAIMPQLAPCAPHVVRVQLFPH
jgi:hypothetical protein